MTDKVCPMTDAAAQAATLKVDACPECGNRGRGYIWINKAHAITCRNKWHDEPAQQQVGADAVEKLVSPNDGGQPAPAAASGPTPRPLKVVELLKVLCNTNTNHYLYDDGFCKSQKLADAARLALEDVKQLERELSEANEAAAQSHKSAVRLQDRANELYRRAEAAERRLTEAQESINFYLEVNSGLGRQVADKDKDRIFYRDELAKAERQRDELQDKVTELTGREAKASGRLETMTEGYETAVRQAAELQAELTATKWALDSANAHNPLDEVVAELQARIDAAAGQKPVAYVSSYSLRDIKDSRNAVVWASPAGIISAVKLYVEPPLSPPDESDAERHRRALHLAQWIAQSLFEMGDIPASRKKVAAMIPKIWEVMK